MAQSTAAKPIAPIDIRIINAPNHPTSAATSPIGARPSTAGSSGFAQSAAIF
jgi:hypothetical protein